MLSHLAQRVRSSAQSNNGLFYGVTLGKVVSTNDPQQMGRLYVHCPELGDPPTMNPEDFESLPLCSYLSPLGGTTTSKYGRGPDDAHSSGPLTYGIWGIPKEGATVGVVCIDGNPNQRLWIGCVYDHLVVGTLPTGRYLVNDDDEQPNGPLTANENKIQPIYDNYTQAFKSRRDNYEWRTRGMDYQAAAINSTTLDDSPSNYIDDSATPLIQKDGSTVNVTQGYAETRIGTKSESPDSTVYGWTTPGFHSFHMDDRVENCRIRLKTAAGHQIILDDTNERIYINTAKGNNWIELDEDGSIDIFSTEKISASARHINLTAEETIRLYGKTGVHIRSDEDIHITGKNLHQTTSESVFTTAGRSSHTNAGGDVLVTAAGDIIESATNIHESASGDIFNSTGGTHHTAAGGNILETGSSIHMNSSIAAGEAANVEADKGVEAHYVNRYPTHEPWGRTSTKSDNSTAPKYGYDDPNVGREHKSRGKFWRR